MRFRYVLAMVLDGARFLEFWGGWGITLEWVGGGLPVALTPQMDGKVSLNMPGGPKISKTGEGWLKHAWRSQNLKDARRLA